MPRAMRVEYPGAIDHVMDRGDRREDIFVNDADRQDFLDTLAEACQQTAGQVHAYCLMRNHFRLTLETPGANLAEGRRWFLRAYTIRVNHRQKFIGHVFSGLGLPLGGPASFGCCWKDKKPAPHPEEAPVPKLCICPVKQPEVRLSPEERE
jgi:REP element-mobilizing transposase RayT